MAKKALSTPADILNTIRDNSDKLYASRVPQATQDNLKEIGKAITTDSIRMNVFMDALINRIAQTDIKGRLYQNPLKRLKGPNVPMGSTIQELFVNPAIDAGYKSDPNLLLKTTKPDGKACYYGINRESTYPLTLRQFEIERAFVNNAEFISFYNWIISSLYSGDNIDEFNITKKTLGNCIDNGAMHIVAADIADPKQLAKNISSMSDYFEFESASYCGYNLVNNLSLTSEEKACLTFCPKESQALFLTVDANTEINFEYMANLFNLSLVELNNLKIKLDTIPSEKYDIYAILVDTAAIQIRDQQYRTETFWNGATLEMNMWLHHFEYFWVSMFANCVAFGKPKAEA